MSNVFLSYASEDRPRALALARALEARGWSVWWDRKIVAGQAFDEAIERELESAGSVVVLWSASSIGSEWVKNEAAAAAERGVLVPALIDAVKLPLEFRRRQTADLVGWDGNEPHEGFQMLCAGIAERSAPRVDVAAPTPMFPNERETRLGGATTRRLVVAGLAAALLMAFVASRWFAGPAPPSTDSPPAAGSTLADLAAGVYDGAVLTDSKGSSQSDVTVTITPVDPRRVRVTSDYARLGTVEVEVTRIDAGIQSARGDTALRISLDEKPPSLFYSPHGEITYSGRKR